jgi:hypothetical protein
MLRMHMTIAIPSHLSDGALIAEVARCACDERHATAQLVAHLAELDARRLYLGAGKAHGVAERSENDAVSWGFSPVPERAQQHHRAPRSHEETG